MRVIGTAGHVDHGKSTLIAALTGTHPDRLKEEQIREMTIELGFGWMTLPNGEEIGIVDVPGHRDFIENMLSGIGGIDAALLIIAADEGVMPQTREHLAILDLLEISAGLIVLTKIDLASDSTWLDLVETDIRHTVSTTLFKDVPIVRVSAKTGAGLDELIRQLQALLQIKPQRPDLDRPRLPIDRVFTMSGFGTVVTGTLSDGHFSIGDEVEILPNRINGRIRGLQTHKKKEDIATPGSRTAINISGVNTEQLNRGNVVTHPGQYQPARRLDARFRLLQDVSLPINHGQEIKFFSGTSETIGILRLLGMEELQPGLEAWIQLELREPVVVVRGDRYILRRPSPGETLGGGTIIDPAPKGRHKRFDENILRTLESLTRGSPAEILLEAVLAGSPITTIKEAAQRSRLDSETTQHALAELIKSDSLILLESGNNNQTSEALVAARSSWLNLQKRIVQVIEDYHSQFPLRRGIPREELKSKIKLQSRQFNTSVNKLTSEHLIKDNGAALGMPGHEVRFDGPNQARVQALMRKFETNPFNPPSVKECHTEAGEEIVNALVEMEHLIIISTGVIFRKKDYDEMVDKIRDTIMQKGEITLAEVRDLFNSSRKYTQALLEHLDTIGMTIRDGDHRKLKK